MGSIDTTIPDFVTIIVKAPNQQIADQTIQCHLNWTIKRLKDYLSEVYPSKPKLEEQKLIYSGKLLTDSAVLKDVLRTFEGQENHTVHLVCTTKAQKMAKIPSSTNSSNARRPNYSSNERSSNIQSSNTPTSDSTSGNVPGNGSNPPSFDYFNTNQFSTNNFDPRSLWPSSAPMMNTNDMDPNQQYMYMQQLYAQYISQYMQMMSQPGFGYMASTVPHSVPRTSQTTVLPDNNNVFARDQLNADRNQARDLHPGVGAVGNDIEEEDGRNNRDWLDWFYVFSRIFVLFTIVYFYSTPLRLLAVLLIVCMFYLHQNMRIQYEELNLNNNNNNNNVINNNVNINQNNDNQPAVENVNAEVTNRQTREAAANRNEEVSTGQPTVAESVIAPVPERLSAISITILAIRTFFLSLVPDQPVL